MWLFVQASFGLRWGTDLSFPAGMPVQSLDEPMPDVKALAYYEWVHDLFYELLFRYIGTQFERRYIAI